MSRQKEEMFEKVVEYNNNYEDSYFIMIALSLIGLMGFNAILIWYVPEWNNQLFPILYSILFWITALFLSWLVGKNRKVYWRKVK